ncbi:MAG: hypothetical protein ACO4AI_05500 [Prochlorothrix sp.]|nr:hypothetical protein [Prochlorothrix sp.]
MTVPPSGPVSSFVIANIYTRALDSGRLTCSDRQYIRDAILSCALNSDDCQRLDRLIYGLQRGRLLLYQNNGEPCLQPCCCHEATATTTGSYREAYSSC